jgi:ABC-type oligopeptide transport system substrate-binding subunit
MKQQHLLCCLMLALSLTATAEASSNSSSSSKMKTYVTSNKGTYRMIQLLLLPLLPSSVAG